MVILSRHFSQACKLPTALFNELARWGGELGALVQGEMKERKNLEARLKDNQGALVQRQEEVLAL